MSTLETSATLNTSGATSPGWKALGIDRSISPSGERTTLHKGVNWRFNDGQQHSTMNLMFSPAYAMGCCGAATMSSLSGYIYPHDRENVVLALWRTVMEDPTTYYAIASSSQLNNKYVGEYALLPLLMELGLKEVFKSPNRNHGPNNMHLMVWDPIEAQKAPGWAKYLWLDNSYWIGPLPLSMKSMDEKQREEIFAKWATINKAEANAAKEKLERDKQSAYDQMINAVEIGLYSKKYMSNSQLQYLDSVLRKYGYEKSVQAHSTVGLGQGAIWKA